MDQGREWACGYVAGMTTKKSKVIPRPCLEYKLVAANARAEEALSIARELKKFARHEENCGSNAKYSFRKECSCGLPEALQRLEKAEAQSGWKIPKAGSATTPTSGHQKINATTIP